jgi:hypothetical protein
MPRMKKNKVALPQRRTRSSPKMSAAEALYPHLARAAAKKAAAKSKTKKPTFDQSV